ncbi:MAG TPA: SDR family oxidoreductase [Kofleriaceae bacterium]|nr:SDR family oxidoreductase [Kofleriaceae bacterium]
MWPASPHAVRRQVTGGGRSIGRAIARWLAEDGVACASSTGTPRAGRDAAREYSERISFVRGDVARERDVRRPVTACLAWRERQPWLDACAAVRAADRAVRGVPGGIVAPTHALAIRLGPAIRVNCISPGWSATDDLAPRAPPRALNPRADHVGRSGRPDDVAGCARGSCPARRSFVTGQNLVGDGGTRKTIYL